MEVISIYKCYCTVEVNQVEVKDMPKDMPETRQLRQIHKKMAVLTS